jgi:hypothetical protein
VLLEERAVATAAPMEAREPELAAVVVVVVVALEAEAAALLV